MLGRIPAFAGMTKIGRPPGQFFRSPVLWVRTNIRWYDMANATAYRANHGLSFDLAKQAFADPFCVEREDLRDYCGEARCRLAAGGLLDRGLNVRTLTLPDAMSAAAGLTAPGIVETVFAALDREAVGGTAPVRA